MTKLLLAALLLLVVITAVATVRMKNLFASTILLGIYSLLMALTWTLMQALDVAFTEAAVGAGISTILLIGALVHVGSKEKMDPRPKVLPLLATMGTAAVLIYGTFDMPRLGQEDAPVHQRAGAFYVSEESHERTHAPNMVTAVLASYRGYDTLFETAVIFVAGLGMILLLRSPARMAGEDEDGGADETPPAGDAA